MHMNYEAQQFNIPALEGISAKSIEEHLGLYQGYVKNFNEISLLLPELAKDSEKNKQALSELIRRRSFEFDGMRLHELYFAQFEGGAKGHDEASALSQALAKDYKKPEHVEPYLKMIGNMRGFALVAPHPAGNQASDGIQRMGR